MTSGREIYWIGASLPAAKQEKIDILKKVKVEARILPDFPTLIRTYPETRLNTIIIDDEILDGKHLEQLSRLTVHPEYAGVRFILSVTRGPSPAVDRAIALGFRDLIPLDLPPELWVRRYSFAASGHASTMAVSYPQITMRNISALHIPARIAWMNEKELWLESRLTPPTGAILTLGGGLAGFLGVNHLTLKVVAHHRTRLHFRYSEALLCRWEIASTHQDKKVLLQDFLRQQPRVLPRRVYAIIRAPELRRELLRRLDPQNFQVTVALNKANMIHEPRFIEPDVIVIEDRMCLGANRASFKEMLDNLKPGVLVLIIGPQTEAESFAEVANKVRLVRSSKLPPNLDEFLGRHSEGQVATENAATLIPKNHRISFAHVLTPARMTLLHPDAVQLALSWPLGRFGICQLESPILHGALERSVAFKVTSCREHSLPDLKEFPYILDGLLVDLRQPERRRLKDRLVSFYQQKLEESLDSRRRTVVADAMELSPAAQPEALEAVAPDAPIVINPSVEEQSTDASDVPVPPFRIPRELKIALWTIVGFCIIFVLIVKFRPSLEEQGGAITEQLRIFQKQHGGQQKAPE